MRDGQVSLQFSGTASTPTPGAAITEFARSTAAAEKDGWEAQGSVSATPVISPKDV
jgi:hypothetical protein